ncbi:transposase [Streptomyces sp. NPDC056161]|uniref:transposase n=1 Tax=Streptomyces sp. NPDC056161 TaxID=3345732 RepID=UPI0035D56091
MAVRPAAGPGRNPARAGDPLTRPAGGRARRHHPDGPRHPRRAEQVHQAGGQSRWDRISAGPSARAGHLRHRTLIDAVFGPATAGETTYAPRLLPSLRPGMILPADRNFGAQRLLADVAATGAEVLVRLKNGRRMPVLARFPDGSCLSALGSLRVRVIDCEITITTAAGKHTGLYRLATTLLDHHRHPAAELATLYHQRWEIETAYLELKSTILGGRVLRARTPEGIDQEIYALLVVYQLLRTAMADATSTRPGTDPDRVGFSIAWQAARDQVVLAAGVIADTVIDPAGTIGRHVLAGLLPERRLRVSPRIVQRAISKYQARGPRIDRTSYKATTSIEILAATSP